MGAPVCVRVGNIKLVRTCCTMNLDKVDAGLGGSLHTPGRARDKKARWVPKSSESVSFFLKVISRELAQCSEPFPLLSLL